MIIFWEISDDKIFYWIRFNYQLQYKLRFFFTYTYKPVSNDFLFQKWLVKWLRLTSNFHFRKCIFLDVQHLIYFFASCFPYTICYSKLQKTFTSLVDRYTFQFIFLLPKTFTIVLSSATRRRSLLSLFLILFFVHNLSASSLLLFNLLNIQVSTPSF